MTPHDIHAGLKSLCGEIGPKAAAHAGLSDSYGLYVSVSPLGLLGAVTLSSRNLDSWEEVIPAAKAVWEEHRDLHASNTTKGMALAIIRLTAEYGECTDAALRAEFTAHDVIHYGDAAADLATEMGGNGPFRIVRLTGANDMGQAA